MKGLERRLQAEWNVLQAMVACNPGRLVDPAADDLVLSVTLTEHAGLRGERHSIRVAYPVHFPAVPMELYLGRPVQHPNVHPQTGFVCLWDRHRVSNTIEHALHKVAAMLAGRLYNAAAPHVMQPEALAQLQNASKAVCLNEDQFMQGVAYAAPYLDRFRDVTGRGKSRLS